MQIQIIKITDTKYSFKADGFEFFASADATNGRWMIPSFQAGHYNVLQENTAKMAYNQVVMFLQKNPLYMKTSTIDGKTNKRIYKKNPQF